MDYPAATVTISGPGMTFDDIIVTIQQALANRGYRLMITNEFPITPEQAETLMSTKTDRTYPVHISVNHCPWGG